MSEVFEKSRTQGNARLVLLALSDSCSDEGVCFPSLKTIAKKANISEETTRKFLHAFEKIGLVESEERFSPVGRRTSNTYKINLNKVGNDELTKDVIYLAIPKSKHRTSDGMNQFTPSPPEPVHTIYPMNQFIPSLMNHHKEPKIEPSSESSAMASRSLADETNSNLDFKTENTSQIANSVSYAQNSTEKKTRKTKLVDDLFIAKLKEANPQIDFDTELRKMDNWLLAHAGRQKTRAFVTNWINRCVDKKPQPTNQSFEEIDWSTVKPNL